MQDADVAAQCNHERLDAGVAAQPVADQLMEATVNRPGSRQADRFRQTGLEGQCTHLHVCAYVQIHIRAAQLMKQLMRTRSAWHCLHIQPMLSMHKHSIPGTCICDTWHVLNSGQRKRNTRENIHVQVMHEMLASHL